jgi:hypothetical protein
MQRGLLANLLTFMAVDYYFERFRGLKKAEAVQMIKAIEAKVAITDSR